MGLFQTQELLHSKGDNKVEMQPIEWEKHLQATYLTKD